MGIESEINKDSYWQGYLGVGGLDTNPAFLSTGSLAWYGAVHREQQKMAKEEFDKDSLRASSSNLNSADYANMSGNEVAAITAIGVGGIVIFCVIPFMALFCPDTLREFGIAATAVVGGGVAARVLYKSLIKRDEGGVSNFSKIIKSDVVSGVAVLAAAGIVGAALGSVAKSTGFDGSEVIRSLLTEWGKPAAVAAGAVTSLYALGRDALNDRLGWKSAAKAALGATIVGGGIYLATLPSSLSRFFGAQQSTQTEQIVTPVPLPRILADPPAPQPVPETLLTVNAFVKEPRLNLRISPNGQVIKQFECGDGLHADEPLHPGWVRLRFPHGNTAYIWGQGLSADRPSCAPK